MVMEDTQDSRGNKNYLNPLKKTILQQITNPHVTLYMRARDFKVLSEWLSYKERRVDALALRADERRDKLR